MRVRFSTVIGLAIADETTDEEIGVIRGILIHPDTGKVEGFFAGVPSFLWSQEAFLAAADIAGWGRRVRVRRHDALSSLEDHVRLRSLVEEGRTVLDQRIVTESGSFIGVCRDVQFDTHTFMVEWLLPRKFLRWQRALPVTSIVQVRTDAIVVRDAVTIPDADTGPSVLETLNPLGTTPAGGAAMAAYEEEVIADTKNGAARTPFGMRPKD